jgi:hypothetical protein
MKIKQKIDDLNCLVKREFEKFDNAANKIFANCALLQEENRLLFEQNNEKTTRASIRSTVIGKGRAKIMTYDEILAAQSQRDAEESGFACRTRKNYNRQKTVLDHSSDSPSHAKEVEKGIREIETMGLGGYYSVLRF